MNQVIKFEDIESRIISKQGVEKSSEKLFLNLKLNKKSNASARQKVDIGKSQTAKNSYTSFA